MSNYQTRERPTNTSLPDEPYYQQPLSAAPSRTGSNARLGLALLLVGMIWLGLEMLGGRPFGGSQSLIAPAVVTGDRLVINAESADVVVRAWDGNQIRITPRYRGGSPSDYRVNVQTQGDTVRVSQDVQACFMCQRDLNYLVELPAATALDINTTSGDIELRGGMGSDTKLQTTSGDIEIEGADGMVRANSVSGSISIGEGRNAQLELSSTSGSIEYEGSLAPGSSTIRTVSGNVELQLPENSAIQLDASTISGSVENDFPQGRGDTTNLTIESTSGSISVEED